MKDLTYVVARDIDFEGEWPVVGGITGTDISIRQLLALGEKVCGERLQLIYFYVYCFY